MPIAYSNFHVGAVLLSADGQLFTDATLKMQLFRLPIVQSAPLFQAICQGVRDFQKSLSYAITIHLNRNSAPRVASV